MALIEDRPAFAHNALVVAATFALCMLAAWGLLHAGFQNENVFMAFIVGVMIAVMETKSFWWGAALSLTIILGFNFLFADPKLTLHIYNANYLVSFTCFIVAALIVGTLATKLRREAAEATRRQKLTAHLFSVSKGFLNLPTQTDACHYAERVLARQLDRDAHIVVGDPANEKGFPPFPAINPGLERKTAHYCFSESIPTGRGQALHPQAEGAYLPLKNKSCTIGVLAIPPAEGELTDDDLHFIDAVISQILLVSERAELEREARNSKLAVEREKVRNNLLSSISHDIRTPLAGIAGGTDLLLEKGSEVDEATRAAVLRDMESDALWLSGMVENLLSMTRLQDEDLALTKKVEVVDDVLSEAVSRATKWRKEHDLVLTRPDDIILAPMDGKLITQVLVNLIDNAFRHTQGNSRVEVSACARNGAAVFSVADNGSGIDDALKDKIFARFFSADDRDGAKRGAGLGLSICKSIVEMHGGEIGVRDNEQGGATFWFSLPLDSKIEPLEANPLLETKEPA